MIRCSSPLLAVPQCIANGPSSYFRCRNEAGSFFRSRVDGSLVCYCPDHCSGAEDMTGRGWDPMTVEEYLVEEVLSS